MAKKKGVILPSIQPLTKEEAEFLSKNYKATIDAANLYFVKNGKRMLFEDILGHAHECSIYAVKTFKPEKKKSFKYWLYMYLFSRMMFVRKETYRFDFVDPAPMEHSEKEVNLVEVIPDTSPLADEVLEEEDKKRIAKEKINHVREKLNKSDPLKSLVLDERVLPEVRKSRDRVAKERNVSVKKLARLERGILKEIKTILLSFESNKEAA